MKRNILIAILLVVLGGAYWLFAAPSIDSQLSIPTSAEALARGEYLVIAGGCVSCHRAEEGSSVMSGGYAMETDFGTFYAPNITADPDTGIGNWNAADFIAALKHGRSPDGSFYFPAFPYRAYAGLSDEEVLDIAAYLLSTEPASAANIDAETPAWLARWMVAGWNKMADMMQPGLETPADPELARGAHLARHLGHCGECHTPRGIFGIPDLTQEFAGAQIGEEIIEAIDAEALEDWTKEDFEFLLFLGMKPDSEFVGGDMNDVIEHNTSKLTAEDQSALAAFFTR